MAGPSVTAWCARTLRTALAAFLLSACGLLVGLGDPKVLEDPDGSSGADGAEAGIESAATDTGSWQTPDVTVDVGGELEGGTQVANGGPVVIASGQNPKGIAVDETGIYWTFEAFFGFVMACLSGSCDAGPDQLVETEVPAYIAALGGSLYWSGARGDVWSCMLPCDGPATLVAAQDYPGGIAVNTYGVFWTTGITGTVRQCPLNGCVDPLTLASGITSPGAIAVDANNVYWTTGDGLIQACPIAGCPQGATTLVGGQSRPDAIAADGTYVYWATFGGSAGIGNVARCAPTTPLGQCSGYETLAPLEAAPVGIAVDTTGVYWLDQGLAGDGLLRRCALDSNGRAGRPTTLASGLAGPAGIALDVTNVYWTNALGGTVMSLHK
jgi:hypothetical protein